MNPGACYFTFSNLTTMTIRCTIDVSNITSRIPSNLLSSSYMAKITNVVFYSGNSGSPATISVLPKYICDLPSGEIDLSFQGFTILNDMTFPCLDSFKDINLAFNQLTAVSMSNGNFQNLASLDLSSNRLTSIPYSILNPTPTSLNYLDLRNNSINYFDLFLYTLKNITIDLDDNPINSSVIINPQNVTLANSTLTSNITLPPVIANSTIIITDALALTYGLCNNFQSLRNYLRILKAQVFQAFVLCQCDSINLRQVYQQNGLNITNDFSCSVATQEAPFYSLNISSCTDASDFQSGLCATTAVNVCFIIFSFFFRKENFKFIKRMMGEENLQLSALQ